MKYQDIFNTSVEGVSKAVDDLRGQGFVGQCVAELGSDGIQIDLDEENDLSSITDGAGLYCFWIDLSGWHKNTNQPWEELLGLFSDEWLKPAENIKYFPKSNKGNIEKTLKDSARSGWIPLYIGKSEKVIDRVKQHVELSPEKKTYALKLNARAKQLEGAKINITSLPLDVNKDNYFLVGLVEYLIRQKMLPIVGKQ